MNTTITAQLATATRISNDAGRPVTDPTDRAQYMYAARLQLATLHYAAAYLTATIGHDELTTDDLPALWAEVNCQQAQLDSYGAAARRLNGKDGRDGVLDSDLVDVVTYAVIEVGRERVRMEAEAIIRLAVTAIRELSDF